MVINKNYLCYSCNSWLKKTWVYLCYLLLISFNVNAQNGDITLLRKIHNPLPLKTDKFFRFTGETVTPLAAATPLSYFIAAAFTQKGVPLKQNLMFQNGLTSTLCIAGSGLLSTTLKYTIKRTRPYDTYADIIAKDNPHTFSFPSGHTTFAFATATSVALIERKWYYTIPLYGWAICVGYSRMHLGVHYPGDVFAGALIGTGMSFAMYYLGQHIFMNK
ncbi:MAG TPA: phosphatase PAP2 family protein [Flavobacteriales bacterium]|nr:phosphatase PAP2 family protein [Flavobacteriales bacterium]